MAAPSLISTRRFSAPTRLRLQVLFARAWEALADTYQRQAAEFVRRLKTSCRSRRRWIASSARWVCRRR